MAEHNDLGRKGEQLAIEHLIKQRYVILHTNWRWQKAEVDIIAEFNDQVIFVEVKTRKSRYFGDPEFFVGAKKQKILIKAAHFFMEGLEEEKEARFDVISIVINDKSIEIKHIQDAFHAVS